MQFQIIFILMAIGQCYCLISQRISHNADSNGINLEIIQNGQIKLQGILGLSLPLAVNQGIDSDCSPSDPEQGRCTSWGDYANNTRKKVDDDCLQIEWTSSYASRLEDCFDIVPGVHWYGGGEMFKQVFPIEREPRIELPVVTADSIGAPLRSFGGITENYWLLSNGVAINVDEHVPLFFSLNTTQPNRVCLVALNEYPYKKRSPLNLKYTVCTADNVKLAHLNNFKKFYKTPTDIPDESMLLKPLWSTWAQFKEDVNQSLVLDYARQIIENGFSWSSHVEIDDHWETCYGEHEFNLDKFPDPAELVRDLKAMGFRATLWIHPFINIDCPSFQMLVNRLYLVRDPRQKPQITSWWKGTYSGIFDMTLPSAVFFWKARLQKLIDNYGIDSFKFDAGETNWLPYASELIGDATLTPNLYSSKFVEVATSYGKLIEVRTGRRDQDKPMFVRMLDKDSRWGYENGLKSLIPTLLHFGIVGYPFVLPDMIGGNAYLLERVTKELFIRWMQANIFMPAVQFSVAPWEFDQQTVNITLQVIAERQKYQEKILNAARQSVLDGTPINRPIFWVDPIDQQTFDIDNQYMLGDDILVAPVLDLGAVTRDIYLPAGVWTDAKTSAIINGPTWLRNYSAPIDVIPYFFKG